MPEERDLHINFLANSIREHIEKRVPYEERNMAARRWLERYGRLMDASLPELSEEERSLLCTVFDADAFYDRYPDTSTLWSKVHEAPAQVYAQHGVDSEAFEQKLKALTEAERLAVIDLIERICQG